MAYIVFTYPLQRLAFAVFLYFKLDEMNALSDEGISVDKS